MSAELYSKVDITWAALGFNDLEAMAFIRFSARAQTFVAPVLRCDEMSVWREVRFLLNALTFFAQVAEMENVHLLFSSYPCLDGAFAYRFKSLYH